MAALSFGKKDLPFLLRGKGELLVETGRLRPQRAIPEDTASLLSVGFKASGDQPVTLGQDDSVKLGLSATANTSITTVFASTAGRGKLLKAAGLADVFKGGANDDKVVLLFDAGASVDAQATGAFTYSVLKSTVELDAGADAGYTYARALDKAQSLETILPAFFKTMRLPEQGGRAPDAGEAISLRYGGYLRLAAEVSAGYQLTGTKAVSIGQLALSEKYDLSVLGKIGLAANVAGRYAIVVTRADGLDGWARVQVRRHRSKDLKIAADVSVDFKNDLTDLPADANEFLGAVLGTNAKNFLNLFDKALELRDFDTFSGAIDGLARKYVEEFVGKGFDALKSKTEFQKFLGRVNRAVESRDTLGDRALTLFDRHFDQPDALVAFLERIQALGDDGVAMLRKDLDPRRWAMLAQLTDGDPLGFLLQQVTIKGTRVDSLAELKTRASRVLALLRDAEHQELRDAVATDHRFGGRTAGARHREDRPLRHTAGGPLARFLGQSQAGVHRSARGARPDRLVRRSVVHRLQGGGEQFLLARSAR
jgi:hypothetical protein